MSVISNNLKSRLNKELVSIENIDKSKLDIDHQSELTHIVALTSYSNESVIRDCYAAGVKKVINKPLKYKTLHKVMWKHYFRIGNDEYQNVFKNAFNMSFEESEEEQK